MISNPLPFRQTVAAPTKRLNTRHNYSQPTCSKTLDLERNSGGNPITYARKGTPQPINHERSEDWLKRKDQPRNIKGKFTSPNKIAETEVDLNLSIVSDEEFDCYNNSNGKPVLANIDDELQLLPKEN